MFNKKILSLIMVICISLSCGALVKAQPTTLTESNEEAYQFQSLSDEDIIITPFWDYTHDTATLLSISSSGVSTSTARITGYSGTTTKVQITLTLQKKGGLFNLFWNDVTEWSQTFNNYYGTLSKTYSVSGGTYRVRADYVAYKGSASETTTAYSSEVKY